MKSAITRLTHRVMDHLVKSLWAIAYVYAMGLSPVEAAHILGEASVYGTPPGETATGQEAA